MLNYLIDSSFIYESGLEKLKKLSDSNNQLYINNFTLKELTKERETFPIVHKILDNINENSNKIEFTIDKSKIIIKILNLYSEDSLNNDSRIIETLSKNSSLILLSSDKNLNFIAKSKELKVI